MSLAAVRNIGSPRMLRTAEDVEDFEQEIVDQYSLAMAAAGLSDGHVANSRAVVVEFARSLAGPLWSATCDDAHRFFVDQRQAGRRVSTRAGKAGALAQFFEFVISRYEGDIHALTSVVVEQPIEGNCLPTGVRRRQPAETTCRSPSHHSVCWWPAARLAGQGASRSVLRVRDPRALPAGPTGGPMRNGGGAGLITVRQVPGTAARESNI